MKWVRALRRAPVQLLIFLIELYRTYVSPTRMPVCRFTPTCSEYAVTALRERGFVWGVGLTIIRIAKCAPWHPGGWDPVPERRDSRDGGNVPAACPASNSKLAAEAVAAGGHTPAPGTGATTKSFPATAE